jgi:hypothetical protein
MKNTFDKQRFRELAEMSGEYSISIYLPSNKDRWIDPVKDINRIKLKNFIKKISQELKNRKVEDDKIKEYLDPLQELLNDDERWGDLMPGMVIFRNKEFFEFFIMPVDIEEMYYIGWQFYLQPMIQTIHLNNRFYLLSLDLNSVELFRANVFDIQKLKVDEFIPASIEEALGSDYQADLQFRSGQEGGGRALFHGQKEGMELKKTEAEKFIRNINDGISKILKDRDEKLVVACVDYLFSIYNEINSYPNLARKHISLSPAKMKPEELKERAMEILQEDLEQERDNKKHAFNESVEKTNVSETIVSAAYNGQVDTLFLAREEMIWGKFYPEETKTEMHKGYHEEDISLNNFATIHTLLKNGEVYVMEKAHLPDPSRPMNALLRYGI